jgi:hydroxymethylpyrimidine/phosphomethylpyrimidine kinase
MKKNKTILCIAASDSGGSAGIQADIKTCQSIGVFAATAVTALTAQNPDSISNTKTVSPAFFSEQLDQINKYFKPKTIKIGLIPTLSILQALLKFLKNNTKGEQPFLVFDPIISASSGKKLISDSAIKYFKQLIAISSLCTPNIDEASRLLKRKIQNQSEQIDAARTFYKNYNCSVIVKGGHLTGKESADIFFDGKKIINYTSPRLEGINSHGSGCTFSSAIACFYSQNNSLHKSIKMAKKYMTACFHDAIKLGEKNEIFLNHDAGREIIR